MGKGKPESVRFADLLRIVQAMGYSLARQRGSHQIYKAPGLPLINLQSDGNKAKAYQVDQVIGIIDTYGLEVK